jgi:ADP-ribose pyrophosphatase YjhB (NUDIX family)
MSNSPKWLEWAQRLQALSQSGLTYSTNPFEIERYHAISDIAAEMSACGCDIPFDVIKKVYDQQSGYATPKLDVRGVVFRDDKILLVKEVSDGLWTLPGGWVDVNEPPSQAVEREVLEESGYIVKARKLLAVFDRRRHGHPAYIFHIYRMYFLCDWIGGEPTESIETQGAEYFKENEIPDLSLARTTPEVLAILFQHLREPERPTDFD